MEMKTQSRKYQHTNSTKPTGTLYQGRQLMLKNKSVKLDSVT